MDKPHPVNNFFEELLVVLVIYKMEINESPAFHSLTIALQSANQKSSIFIYDNSPHTRTYSPNENWVITYQHDAHNSGVSKAYNEGFLIAKAQNKKWLLLADQDSTFRDDFLLTCKFSTQEHAEEKIFAPVMVDLKGIISPFRFRFGRGIRLKNISTGRHQLSDKKFINSGLLLSCDLFEASGGFDERYALDFSDLVFIEKLKGVTSTFIVTDSICGHSLFASKCNSLQESLARFKVYSHAADLFGKQTEDFWIIFWKLIRAVGFFFRFFNWHFITIALSKR